MLKVIRRLIESPPLKVRLPETIAHAAPDAVEASLQAIGRSRKAQVAPAVLFLTSAGVAFWWWTQWARGRAESEAAEKDGSS